MPLSGLFLKSNKCPLYQLDLLSYSADTKASVKLPHYPNFYRENDPSYWSRRPYGISIYAADNLVNHCFHCSSTLIFMRVHSTIYAI